MKHFDDFIGGLNEIRSSRQRLRSETAHSECCFLLISHAERAFRSKRKGHGKKFNPEAIWGGLSLNDKPYLIKNAEPSGNPAAICNLPNRKQIGKFCSLISALD